jgi:hypothetical protein
MSATPTYRLATTDDFARVEDLTEMVGHDG